MKPAFRFVPIASSLHDTRAITALQAEFSPALERMGGACWEDPSDPWTPVIWFVLTGGTEQRLLDAMADHERRVGPGPVMLLAHGGQNSLPAALETLARLQQEGRKGRVLFVSSPSDAEGFELLKQGIHALESWRKLRLPCASSSNPSASAGEDTNSTLPFRPSCCNRPSVSRSAGKEF